MIDREKVLDLINDKLERLESMIKCYDLNLDKIEGEYKESHGGALDIEDLRQSSKEYQRIWNYYNEDSKAFNELSDLVYEVCEL